MSEFIKPYTGRTRIYNDILFVATYIEYISRELKIRQVEVADCVGFDALRHTYNYADVNHCLPLEQHLYEFQQEHHLPVGSYDMSESYKGLSVESPSRAASPFARIVDALTTDYDEAFRLYWDLLHSWICEWLTNWDLDFYRQPVEFHLHCLKQGFVDIDDYPCI